MNRKNARELMMTVLFQMDAQKDYDVNNFDNYIRGKKVGKEKEYCKSIFEFACGNMNQVDSLIKKYSKKWTIGRIPKADLAVLRLAIIEMLNEEEIKIPVSISINEAVELAKEYGEEASPSYINGILASVAKEKAEEE